MYGVIKNLCGTNLCDLHLTRMIFLEHQFVALRYYCVCDIYM